MGGVGWSQIDRPAVSRESGFGRVAIVVGGRSAARRSSWSGRRGGGGGGGGANLEDGARGLLVATRVLRAFASTTASPHSRRARSPARVVAVVPRAPARRLCRRGLLHDGVGAGRADGGGEPGGRELLADPPDDGAAAAVQDARESVQLAHLADGHGRRRRPVPRAALRGTQSARAQRGQRRRGEDLGGGLPAPRRVTDRRAALRSTRRHATATTGTTSRRSRTRTSTRSRASSARAT